MKKLARNKVSSYPLKIVRADGTEEFYETYEDYVKYSGRKICSRENVMYRNRKTLKNGHWHGEQWILINYQKYRDMFFSEKTFVCDKCKTEKPIKYYDAIDGKMAKNFHKVEYNETTEKHCMDCMREWARGVINSPPLIQGTKTLQDYYDEIEQEKKEKQTAKNQRYYYGKH